MSPIPERVEGQQPRPRWFPCNCSVCECEAPINTGDICLACRQDYHIAPEDEPEAA